jgi:hypothetical protein
MSFDATKVTKPRTCVLLQHDGTAKEQAEAARFYAMTNSVPFETALWLTGEEMRGWMGQSAVPAQIQQPPRLAYLDLGPVLN